jgi:GMP synthase (glutamine-hydrolysing)
LKHKIIVIDPAINTPENDCFNQISAQSEIALEYHLPNFSGTLETTSSDLDSIKGLIIFGSGCSVYDNKPWQTDLIPWIREVIKKKIPILGICYGHQLLAHMHGGIISHVNKDKSGEYGLRTLSLVNNGGLPLSSLIGDLVVSHSEHVSALPLNWETWGQSSKVKIDAMKHHTLPVWGFQAHPEATDAFLSHQGIAIKDSSRFDYGRKITQAFLDYCKIHA